MSNAPHINLSPEQMDFASGDAGALDFGLDLSPNESDSLENLTVLPGLRVRGVRSGSPADRAGLRSGDVLLSVDGVATNEVDALASIASASESEEFPVEARRGTTVFKTTMSRPGRRLVATPEALYRADPLRSRAGYRTELLATAGGAQQTVARVQTLFPASPLNAAGVQVGDVIVALDGEPVQSAQGLVNALSRRKLGESVNLTLIAKSEPEAGPRDLRLRLWKPERRLSAFSLWPLFTYESSLDPEQVEFQLVDLILFPLFSYERDEGEKTYRLLGLFKFGTGYGELLEESPTAAAP
ncbi:PDZ domain-containing protein [Gilvimarinus sp. F26214L]|uniref:PDZ domain-containing protein n=1 Tax=Gilvimarinus sp. DZF01 TaxID=3461371 RepID=UPI004046791A